MSRKGGYKIINFQDYAHYDVFSGDLYDLPTIVPKLYEDIKNSYDKPILFTGIVLNGEHKKDVFTTIKMLPDRFIINLYGELYVITQNGSLENFSENFEENITILPDDFSSTIDKIGLYKLESPKEGCTVSFVNMSVIIGDRSRMDGTNIDEYIPSNSITFLENTETYYFYVTEYVTFIFAKEGGI